MMQLMARYSLYESMIATIEQNCGFIFDQYSEIHADIFGSESSVTFWKPAMAKWIAKMECFHPKTNLIFYDLCQLKVKNDLK